MVSEENKLIVLMPPKTASNSLRHNLVEIGIRFSQPTTKPNKPLIHLKLDEIIELYGLTDLLDYKILQITRCPYQRFMSSFYHQKNLIQNRTNIIFENYNLVEFTNHLVESLNKENFIENFYGDSSFVVSSIRSGVSWGGSRLFLPQSSWCNLPNNVQYFKLEEISNNIEPLNQFLEKKLNPLKHINRFNTKTRYDENLYENIKNIVSEIYSEDFINLGYEK